MKILNNLILIFVLIININFILSMKPDENNKYIHGSNFIHAVRFDDIEKVKELINSGVDINYQDSRGDNALFIAIEINNNEIAKLLLHHGIDFNCKNRDGDTPLMMACEEENKELVKDLIDLGANIYERDRLGKTALFYAEEYEILKLLVDNGAHIDTKDKQSKTCIFYANNLEHIDNLIKLGADLNAQDKDGSNIFMSGKLYAFFQNIIKQGANINLKNKKGINALHDAILNGREKYVEEFIELGANVNEKTSQGQTPLILSVSKKYDDKIIDLLLSAGADIFMKDNKNNSVLDIAKEEFLDAHPFGNYYPKVLNVLLKHIKLQVFNAIKSGNFDTVKKYVKFITMRIYDEEGNNPLHYAAQKKDIKIFKLIYLANPNLLYEKNNIEKAPLDIYSDVILHLILIGKNN